MKALNPATNQLIEPDFALGGVADVDRAATLTDEAFDVYSHTSLARRAAFLDSNADNLDEVRQALAARAADVHRFGTWRYGGMALFRRAQLRPEPIPVFTEMTSVNPTFILPHAQAAKGAQIGDGFIERMLVNVGQACLKPALLIAIEGPGFEAMRAAMVKRFNEALARPMLTPGIHTSYVNGLDLMENTGARRIAEGSAASAVLEGVSALLEVDGAQFLTETLLAEEVFGPSALLVKVKDEAEMLAVARSLRSQLAAAMHLEDDDFPLARRLLPVLERRTGRIVINAFAHPQEVTFATVHGGPFPATSDSRFTSVGMTSIERFLRPVAYQGFPQALLPDVLQDANPLELPRLIDGV